MNSCFYAFCFLLCWMISTILIILWAQWELSSAGSINYVNFLATCNAAHNSSESRLEAHPRWCNSDAGVPLIHTRQWPMWMPAVHTRSKCFISNSQRIRVKGYPSSFSPPYFFKTRKGWWIRALNFSLFTLPLSTGSAASNRHAWIFMAGNFHREWDFIIAETGVCRFFQRHYGSYFITFKLFYWHFLVLNTPCVFNVSALILPLVLIFIVVLLDSYFLFLLYLCSFMCYVTSMTAHTRALVVQCSAVQVLVQPVAQPDLKCLFLFFFKFF